MSREHPEFSKPTIAIRRDHAEGYSAQEIVRYNPTLYLSRVLTIQWIIGDHEASVEFDTDSPPRHITVTLNQVFRAFQTEEKRLRRLITLLSQGDVRRLEAVFSVENQEKSRQSLRVEARVMAEASGKRRVVLDFLPENSYPTGTAHILRLNEIPLGLLFVEPQTGSIVDANSRALELLATPEEDLSNIRWQRTPEWLNFVQEVTQQGSVWNRVLEIAAGKTWALFSAQRMADQIVVFAQNISFLQEQLLNLQKVNIGLDNFVYHASHDLRAPLRSMQGLITLLRAETNEKERDKFVELIEGSLKRLDAFLVDLLSISRSNLPERRPLVKINFMLEVEKAVSSFFHLGDNKNLEVSTRISQPVPFVSDLTQVLVILNNIISNAFKYRRYGVRKSRIKIEISVSRTRAHIKISDNGEGIPEEHLPHIFEMFYRATDRNEGSGLGLYIVRETVEKLRGTINVTSKPNRGATFTVVLPNQYQPKKKN